nr:hypothetical protein [Tanacetum cinerariifolium]
MTSFGYRLNPRYAIKECSSCGTLYTRDCSCSKGSVEDKILVPKPPKNYARCGHPVNGPYCQGCTFLRKKLEEDLVTHFQGFQNTSESSDDNTNVVNIPLEPFVIKQDHGSFVNKIICGLNKAPDSPHLHTFSPNQFHCFHYKYVLGDGEACQRCTCKRCRSGLSKGLCLICGNNQNSLNDSPSIFANSSHNPPHIDECCCECGEALDGIICQQCACKSCGKCAHIGYNYPPKVPIISNPEPKFNRYSFFETPKVLLLAWDRFSEIKDAFENNQYKPEDIKKLFRKLLDDLQNIHEELAEFINSPGWNRPAFYDDDDDDVDYTIAITPVLSTKEPDNSLSMGDEHLDTIPATESEVVIKSIVEDLVPIPSESEGIPDIIDDDSLYYENIEYVEASPHDSEFISLEVEKIVIPEDEEIKDDNLREKLLKVNLLIAKIEALKDNPNPSSEFLTKSSSTSPKSFLKGTNTFHNSLPEFENFCFDVEEISSGSTTTYSDISLSEYDAFSFYNDHIEEIRSSSTTTQSNISLPE